MSDQNGHCPTYPKENTMNTNEPFADWDEFEEYHPACPACGDFIDFCSGHGEIGDPYGWSILMSHDEGDHDNCHPAGCDEANELLATAIYHDAMDKIAAGETLNDAIDAVTPNAEWREKNAQCIERAKDMLFDAARTGVRFG